MKKIYILIIVMSIILVAALAYILFLNPGWLRIDFDKESEFSVACEEFGGEWIEEYDECETTSASADIEGLCTEYGGQYHGCASPCRHDSGFGICATVCVQVCSL